MEETGKSELASPRGTGSEGIVVGYILVITSALMTLFHMGVLAWLVALVGVMLLSKTLWGMSNPLRRSHLTFCRRNLVLLVVVVGALYAWLAVELLGLQLGDWSRMNGDQGLDLFKVIGQHWLVHTLVSVLLGLWLLVQGIRGVLRHSDRRTI